MKLIGMGSYRLKRGLVDKEGVSWIEDFETSYSWCELGWGHADSKEGVFVK